MNPKRPKSILVVGDGMADEPLEALDGKTPLQVAHIPNMDSLARNGVVGMVRTVPEGMPPGSDVANMSLMGYAPQTYYSGRAPLEAASMGVEMSEGDLAFRCNLVTLERRASGIVMGDYSGGGISTEIAREYVELLNKHLAGPDLCFYPGIAYRHLALMKNAGSRFESLETTPPHDITGQVVTAYLPCGSGAREVAELMEQGRTVFADLPSSSKESSGAGTANAIWLWGQGHAPCMPTLEERYHVRGVTICAVDLIKGLGRYAGMDSIEVPGATGDLDTNYQGKAVAALKALEAYDFVFLHVEAPDEAGHQGDLDEKIRAIERLDAEVVGLLKAGLSKIDEGYRILVLPDHPTPLRTRTHSEKPVPFLFHVHPESTLVKDLLPPSRSKVTAYNEKEAEQSGIRIEEGHRILELLFS